MPIAAIPTLVALLMRLGPWIFAWLVVTEVEDITESITQPGEGGGIAAFFLGLGAVGTIAVLGMGVWFFFGMKKGS